MSQSPLSPEALAGLERLLNSATPGPWIEDGTLVGPGGEECDASAAPNEWVTFKSSRADADRALWIAAFNALPALIASAEREATRGRYDSHPSCTICKVNYLGEGTCGACLFVANLVADAVIVNARNSKYRAVVEAARMVIENDQHIDFGIDPPGWRSTHLMLHSALDALGKTL